jgi:hypothetical protein
LIGVAVAWIEVESDEEEESVDVEDSSCLSEDGGGVAMKGRSEGGSFV